jgi:hypothetical protein
MDFRGVIAGRFVFHCHILSHEDKGMMNIIEVPPAGDVAGNVPSPAAAPPHAH